VSQRRNAEERSSFRRRLGALVPIRPWPQAVFSGVVMFAALLVGTSVVGHTTSTLVTIGIVAVASAVAGLVWGLYVASRLRKRASR
jgi:hypothetical protein